MSIQSSSTTKSAIVAATMLAIEAEGHGFTNGLWGPQYLKDETPLSRQMRYLSGKTEIDPATGKDKYAYPYEGMTFNEAYVKGAENRMDNALRSCATADSKPGWMTTKDTYGDINTPLLCKPAAEICPNVWAGTAVAYEVGHANLGGDENYFGCSYADGEFASATGSYATGCCAGFEGMSGKDDSGQTNTIYDITEGGQKVTDPNAENYGYFGKGDTVVGKTVCWAHNGGVPSDAALNRDNFRAERTWTEGQEVDLSWVSTANHGGAYEYAIVCDGNETYENFAKNRLTFVEDDASGFYQGLSFDPHDATKQWKPLDWARLDKTTADYNSVNGGQELVSNDKKWGFIPAPNGANQDPTSEEVKQRSYLAKNNFTMRNKLRLPANVHGEKCTLGWFYWGMVSAGTFISCSDITIKPAGVRAGSTEDNL